MKKRNRQPSPRKQAQSIADNYRKAALSLAFAKERLQEAFGLSAEFPASEAGSLKTALAEFAGSDRHFQRADKALFELVNDLENRLYYASRQKQFEESLAPAEKLKACLAELFSAEGWIEGFTSIQQAFLHEATMQTEADKEELNTSEIKGLRELAELAGKLSDSAG